MSERKPVGTCLLKHTERNYRAKECAVCGNLFKPKYPAEKTCCNRCRAQYRDQKRKEKSSRELMHSKIKRAEYRRKHYFCETCGKPLTHGNQKICFACMIDKYKQGDRSRSVKQYFYNRGYTADEIDEVAMIAAEAVYPNGGDKNYCPNCGAKIDNGQHEQGIGLNRDERREK